MRRAAGLSALLAVLVGTRAALPPGPSVMTLSIAFYPPFFIGTNLVLAGQIMAAIIDQC